MNAQINYLICNEYVKLKSTFFKFCRIFVLSIMSDCKIKFRNIYIWYSVFSVKTWRYIWLWSNVGNNKQIDFLKKWFFWIPSIFYTRTKVKEKKRCLHLPSCSIHRPVSKMGFLHSRTTLVICHRRMHSWP